MDDDLKRAREKRPEEGARSATDTLNQHKGLAHVKSAPGEGAKYGAYQPGLLEDVAKTREKDSGEPLPRGAETILVAEDEDTILEVCRNILARQGYSVLAARTPAEALSLANDYPGEIHLLITDVVMPEMIGGELAEKLQMSRPRMKCLFMSGYAEEFISDRGALPEGMTFVQKPFSPRKLCEKVRQALAGC